MDNEGSIYCLKCPDSNVIRYIGQTTQPIDLRLKQHLWYSIKQRNHLGYWLKSLNKEPIISEIEKCSFSLLNEREIYWINYYQGNNLVNSMKGETLSGHHTHSEETKRKIGMATIKTHTGLRRSEITKEKIRQKSLGRKQSRETINKRLNTKKINGKCTCLEETKEKIRSANKGRIFTEEHKIKLSESNKKKLYVYDIRNKVFKETCIKDFSEFLGIYPNSIASRLKEYPNKVYRNNWLLNKDLEELKKLLTQLGVLKDGKV